MGKRREEQTTDDEKTSVTFSEAGDLPKIVQPESETEMEEVEIQVKSQDDRVKQIVISYETQMMGSREPSPAFSDSEYRDFRMPPRV